MKSFLRKRDLLGQVMSAHIRLSRAIELEVRRRTPVQQISDDMLAQFEVNRQNEIK